MLTLNIIEYIIKTHYIMSNNLQSILSTLSVNQLTNIIAEIIDNVSDDAKIILIKKINDIISHNLKVEMQISSQDKNSNTKNEITITSDHLLLEKKLSEIFEIDENICVMTLFRQYDHVKVEISVKQYQNGNYRKIFEKKVLNHEDIFSYLIEHDEGLLTIGEFSLKSPGYKNTIKIFFKITYNTEDW